MPFEETLSLLDSPQINWKYVTAVLLVAQYVFETCLEFRQCRFLESLRGSGSIQKEIHHEKEKENEQAYAVAKVKFSMVSKTLVLLRWLITIRLELYLKLWMLSGYFTMSSSGIFPSWINDSGFAHSFVFVSVIQVLAFCFHLPLDYYEHFVLEETYGVNKQTIGRFVLNTVKTTGVSLVAISTVTAWFLESLADVGYKYYCYLGYVILGANVTFATLVPALVAPFVNKFRPLADSQLKTAIETLTAGEKFPLAKIHMDHVHETNRRSNWSYYSAVYFIGVPWSKQLILYDVLTEYCTTDEIVALTAYVIGLWKMNHSVMKILAMPVSTLWVLSLYLACIHNKSLYTSFGFANEQPFLIGCLLFMDVWSALESFPKFVLNLASRYFVHEADKFVKDKGYLDKLCSLLLKFSEGETTSKTKVDWAYSTLHNAEPLLSERFSALGYGSEEESDKYD
ncbi:CAAX prenyl protease 1 [Candida viswanathii]|uniref:CAAX prenyl protease 1 n=1 Tax=Candida viswanathii TaxID=5486 RepID=A0A367Y3I0_9ASCO|nr:CAAX prenyl protease 1 [Candida viswanathii]